MASIKNSTSIWGTKPSTRADTGQGAVADQAHYHVIDTPALQSGAGDVTSQAVPSTSLVQSVRKEPKGPMATQYTANITTAKMAGPGSGW